MLSQEFPALSRSLALSLERVFSAGLSSVASEPNLVLDWNSHDSQLARELPRGRGFSMSWRWKVEWFGRINESNFTVLCSRWRTTLICDIRVIAAPAVVLFWRRQLPKWQLGRGRHHVQPRSHISKCKILETVRNGCGIYRNRLD